MKIRHLWHIARTAPGTTTRLFALAEIVCFPVSIVALLSLVSTAVVTSAGVSLPAWWTRYVLPVSCTAAVGYMTNYLAVRMIFEPYTRTGWHWLRFVTASLWRQGLVPARQGDLAEAVGREVADRLLTSEAVTDELIRITESALDDPKFRARLRGTLPAILRDHLPHLLNKLMPDVRSMLFDALAGRLTRDTVRRFLEGVVEPWAAEPENREILITAVSDNLKGQSPRMVTFLKGRAKSLASENQMLGFFINMADGAGIWKGVERHFKEQIESPDGRREIGAMIDDMIASLKTKLDDPGMAPAFEKFRHRAGEQLEKLAEEALGEELPARAGELLDREEFWHWFGEEMVPNFKPALINWLRSEGRELLGGRFDVAGRVRSAITAMDVRSMHEMMDRIATEQLGAIQVLGFVLGVVAGIPLVLLLG